MLTLVASLTLAAFTPPTPILEADLLGRLILDKGSMLPMFRPGTSIVSNAAGVGFRFDGQTGGILLGDPPALQLTKSLSISSLVRLDAYPRPGTGAQIVFRGDDRIALDPYHLTVLPDGHVYLGIENGLGRGDFVSAPIKLGKWTHVLASLDDKSGEMVIWVDGAAIQRKKTKVRPFGLLDPTSSPGVGIGNVQNFRGGHNQPFQGQLAAIAVYDQVVRPQDAGNPHPGLTD